MSPDGSHLVYSTYLGGWLTDRGTGIALNDNRNAYVSGWTISTNLPVVNPYQLKYGGGNSDGFVAKLDSSGGSFDYVTYLGGNGRDPAYAIAADNGNAYIAGNTSSTNFPMVNPYPLPPGILGGYVVVLGDQPVPPEPPVVEFSANNTVGFKPLTIQFTDQSTGHPITWAWDFGDGSTSALQNPVHTYTEAGVYTVSLTASNAFGTDALVKEGYITVMGPIGGDKGFFLVHSNVEGSNCPV